MIFTKILEKQFPPSLFRFFLSRCVPSPKTVHWTVFEFNPGTRDLVRSISPSADGDRGAESRLPARSALLSLRLRGVHWTPAPSPGSKLPGPTRLRAIRAGRSTSLRSALIPNIHYSRSILYDRCAAAGNRKDRIQ